ncbi:hypothetical protein [Prochlorococcus sp. MIT 1307]|uniref:hypothetical protein n=1 Tax=Prochlorococcus sp. MIT 1307 TaxID=3096219 RepID=UPI002A7495E5|nr:hypothetical protein [Prochlorococcus sp. MIT 1307]
MKFTYIIITISLFTPIEANAHNINQIHNLCIKATDYKGCIDFNSDGIKAESSKINSTAPWLRYGDLKINWSKWRSKGSNHIAPALNRDNKPFYIALNCSTNNINTTGENNLWKGWMPPQEKFELKLIQDFCYNNNKY